MPAYVRLLARPRMLRPLRCPQLLVVAPSLAPSAMRAPYVPMDMRDRMLARLHAHAQAQSQSQSQATRVQAEQPSTVS